MHGERTYWVYILASKIGGTLYIGVTNGLVRRIYEHRSKLVPGFTKRYGVARLVYFEGFGDIEFAIRREAPEEMAAGVEDPHRRRGQSRLARPLSEHRRTGGYWVARTSRAMTL